MAIRDISSLPGSGFFHQHCCVLLSAGVQASLLHPSLRRICKFQLLKVSIGTNFRICGAHSIRAYFQNQMLDQGYSRVWLIIL